MTEKLMHVSCLVRDSLLWELLRALEEHKVGNVEVRPVAPPLLALPAPGRKIKGKVQMGSVLAAVRDAMQLKEPIRVPQLARQLNAKKQSVTSAVNRLTELGLVKRTGFGQYTRIKPDPINSNGATGEPA